MVAQQTTTPAVRKRRQGHRATDEERVELQALWLTAYKATGTISGACEATLLERSTIRDWRLRNVNGFAQRFDDIDADIDDMLYHEVMRRAVGEDREEMTASKDGTITVKRWKERSDILLMFLVKRRMPEFRDSFKVDLEGNAGTFAALAPEAAKVQADLEAELSKRRNGAHA